MKNGRKRPWPNLRYHPGMCLEGLSKITIVRTAGLRVEVRTQDIPNTKHHAADSAGTFENHTVKIPETFALSSSTLHTGQSL
jgi:hypothetical protein